MKYPQQMAIESLQVIELPLELNELQQVTRCLADVYLSSDNIDSRKSVLAKVDHGIWSIASDTIAHWVQHWSQEGKVTLIHRGTELPNGGKLDCMSNTYTDGFDSWSPVQVKWLQMGEAEPEPEPIAFDADSLVVASAKSKFETKEEAILRMLTENGRIDGDELVVAITQQAVLEQVGDVFLGGYNNSNLTFLKRWIKNPDNLKLIGDKLQAGTINKVTWAKQRNK